jgi:thiamine-phosphate diphosphorylase
LPRARNLPKLYAIVDVEVCAARGRTPREVARAFLAGGARFLQLRAKTLAGGAFLDLATGIVADSRAVDALVIVNDRPDIAALSGASGVHVGQEDLAVADARRIVGPDAIVGLSTHTLGQVTAGLEQAASYIAIGPVFGTQTKDTGYAAIGLNMVTTVAELAMQRSIPIIAIGGLTLDTARDVIAAGAASIAVITDLMQGDPAARVRDYQDRLAR